MIVLTALADQKHTNVPSVFEQGEFMAESLRTSLNQLCCEGMGWSLQQQKVGLRCMYVIFGTSSDILHKQTD